MESNSILVNISYLLVALLLITESYFDIKTKKINIIFLLFFTVTGVAAALFFKQNGVVSALLGALEGIILLGIAYVTKEGIGYGDGMVILGTGLILGWRNNILMFFAGLLFSSLFSIILLIKDKNRKKRIPFIPFLTLGYLFITLEGDFIGK